MRVSFSRTYHADGWRYSVGARTRPESRNGVVVWVVQKWDGTHWATIGTGTSYDVARTIASSRSECPYCAADEDCAYHVGTVS